ncbi:MAG: hypothetical protein SVR81_08665, partial [Chloroflexota bacterium]|nr:hypothetical protein [Chloroflexota bacterium]
MSRARLPVPPLRQVCPILTLTWGKVKAEIEPDWIHSFPVKISGKIEPMAPKKLLLFDIDGTLLDPAGEGRGYFK